MVKIIVIFIMILVALGGATKVGLGCSTNLSFICLWFILPLFPISTIDIFVLSGNSFKYKIGHDKE
jgi:hypothetical protein